MAREEVLDAEKIVELVRGVFPDSEGWGTSVLYLKQGEGEGTHVHKLTNGDFRRRCMDDRKVFISYRLSDGVDTDSLFRQCLRDSRPLGVQEMLDRGLLKEISIEDYYESYACLGGTNGDVGVRGVSSVEELSRLLDNLKISVGLGVHGDIKSCDHCGALGLLKNGAIKPINPVNVDWGWVSFLTLLKGGRFDVLEENHTAKKAVLSFIRGVTGLHQVGGERFYVIDMMPVVEGVGAESERYLQMAKPAFERLVTDRKINLYLPSR